eukprot:GHVU01130983.1.p1 GENE.GHVU01130983.1~~GHVU01130983.1.p1  ORF type:complete len:458 (-),score=31.00 GHVU01130983.1:1306-2679(-)
MDDLIIILTSLYRCMYAYVLHIFTPSPIDGSLKRRVCVCVCVRACALCVGTNFFLLLLGLQVIQRAAVCFRRETSWESFGSPGLGVEANALLRRGGNRDDEMGLTDAAESKVPSHPRTRAITDGLRGREEGRGDGVAANLWSSLKRRHVLSTIMTAAGNDNIPDLALWLETVATIKAFVSLEPPEASLVTTSGSIANGAQELPAGHYLAIELISEFGIMRWIRNQLKVLFVDFGKFQEAVVWQTLHDDADWGGGRCAAASSQRTSLLGEGELIASRQERASESSLPLLALALHDLTVLLTDVVVAALLPQRRSGSFAIQRAATAIGDILCPNSCHSGISLQFAPESVCLRGAHHLCGSDGMLTEMVTTLVDVAKWWRLLNRITTPGGGNQSGRSMVVSCCEWAAVKIGKVEVFLRQLEASRQLGHLLVSQCDQPVDGLLVQLLFQLRQSVNQMKTMV